MKSYCVDVKSNRQTIYWARVIKEIMTQNRSIVVQSTPAVTQFNSQFIDATTIMGYCNNTNHLKVGLPRVIHKFYKFRITTYKGIACECANKFYDINTQWCLLGIAISEKCKFNLK